MTHIAQISAWLLQGAATLPDTIVTKQVVVSGWFGKVASVASGLVSIVLLVLLVVLVLVALKIQAKVGHLMDRLAVDITPIARHASSIADNVDYITTSVRTDVQQVSQTIQIANDRLNEALALSERRLRELSALLQVVQEEAENTFVSTAATVRAVRAGALAFQREGMEPAPDQEFLDEEEEGDDGYDSATEAQRREGPRIRPRRGGRHPT
jgi:hypothetical protein